MSNIKKAILWCNGDTPSEELVNSLINQKSIVYGVDKGADVANSMGIIIQKVLGDLDSVDTSKWNNKSKKIYDQEISDLGKSIRYLIENKIYEVDILGIDGGNPEHILGIWGNLVEMPGNIKIKLHHEHRITERIHPDEGQLEIFISEEEEFSIFALTPCKNIHLTGSKWEINGDKMELSSRGLHNVGLGRNIKIIADGIIVLITER
ncbi:MAG: hypothetical protein HOJ64_02455 [Euryarchaeota archaeon]|nr:hypothetical protein [Euryarchaeota archaeon]MBT4391913.1 hypothetical protein [Euryarchaeota archaeon]MBT4803109.1 hypothetical protein [Euryarchaeota archaeon]MBT5613715.1 hypothetical protein [Euryarchaeota archaeon]MBT6684214.1 hypothetical protein [Euryarchaeota archaeon]